MRGHQFVSEWHHSAQLSFRCDSLPRSNPINLSSRLFTVSLLQGSSVVKQGQSQIHPFSMHQVTHQSYDPPPAFSLISQSSSLCLPCYVVQSVLVNYCYVVIYKGCKLLLIAHTVFYEKVCTLLTNS